MDSWAKKFEEQAFSIINERQGFIDTFQASLEQFERQQRDFMEEQRKELLVQSHKLEKMQNMINFIQIN